jgi:hypothetical protein
MTRFVIEIEETLRTIKKLLDELEKEGDVSGEYTPWDHGKKED